MTTIEPAPLSGGRSAVIERATGLLLTPGRAWDRIASEPATIRGLYVGYVMILAAAPALAQAVGASLFPSVVSTADGGFVARASLGGVLGGAVASYVLSLVTVAALALLIERLAPVFDGRGERLQAFKVAAYSMTPVWVAGALHLFPPLAPAGTLLVLYGAYLLYLGLPKLMRPAADRALPFVGVAAVAGVALSLASAALLGALAAPGGLGAGAAASEDVLILPDGRRLDLATVPEARPIS